MPWEDALKEEMEPTPVFSPGKSHGQRSLVGYSQWGRKESEEKLQLKQDATREMTLTTLSEINLM